MFNIQVGELTNIADCVNVKEIFFQQHAPFKASFFTLAPQAVSPVDVHKVKEAWLVVSGAGEIKCDDQIQIITKDSVICFDSFQSHSVKNISDVDLQIISIWWD